MATRLQIVWDGDAPGLADRRLSLEAFEPALKQLLISIRRIASDLEMKARGPAHENRRGRLAREAANLDVQIESIRTNSPVTLSTVVVPLETPAQPLLADLAEVSVDEFLADVEREASGLPAHYRVRRFLQALPAGVTHQRYVHQAMDGTIRRDVTVGTVHIVEPRTAAHLVELVGTLVGFGFEEGRAEVKVRATTGELVSFFATPLQVERALELRLELVQVLAVAEGARTRLLRLSTGVERDWTGAERADYLFKKWDSLLSRLAQ